MATMLHDPTAETVPAVRPRQEPLNDLSDKVVALQGIGKSRSNEFLGYIEARLNARGIETIRTSKATNARTAPPEIIQKIATEAHAVVQALAD